MSHRDPRGGTRSGTGSGGVLVGVEYFKVEEGLERTTALLADLNLSAMYEGFIQFDDVLVRPDLLVRTGDHRWRLIEVKSTCG